MRGSVRLGIPPSSRPLIAYDGGAPKVRRAMSFKMSAAISLVAFVGFSPALYAQKAKTPTLGEILKRLEANRNHYDKSLPSLFCDEHVVSQVEPDLNGENAVIDSVFRLKRTKNADHTTTLVESRELQRVNGKPAISQPMMEYPFGLLKGAFGQGLAVVSLSQKACMKYKLDRVDKDRPAAPYIVSFATALTPQNNASCLLHEKGSGRVVIDPASMEITHLQLTVPRHVIISGKPYASPVIGTWVFTVDYAPVVLDGDTFWVPSATTSRDTGKDGFIPTVWSFEATYRNYHRLEVKSWILPGSEEVEP
jgi:hypothetical protein